MTKHEKLRTRIIIARSIKWKPDDVEIREPNKRTKKLYYILNDFKGYNLCLTFDHVPTIQEARDKVRDLYLNGVEWDFDMEMDSI